MLIFSVLSFFCERIKIGCLVRVQCVLIQRIPLDASNHTLRRNKECSSRTSFEENARRCVAVFVSSDMRLFYLFLYPL